MIFAYDKDGIIFAERVYKEFMGDANCVPKLDSEENFAMWHPHKNMLIHIDTDHQRIEDIIRYEVEVPEELNHETVVDFYNRVCRTLDKYSYTPKEERYDFVIHIANNKEAFELNGRGIVTIDDKLTPISGQFAGYGSGLGISIPEELSPRQRLIHYFDRYEKLKQVLRFPIVLMRTNTDEIEIVEKMN